jgi:diguanylate cyclase (GGDEF)-like protein
MSELMPPDPSGSEGEALLVFDPESRRLLFANAAAAHLFGLHEDSPNGRTATDFLPEFADLTPREFNRPFESGGGEVRMRVRIERLRPARAASAGAVAAFVSAARSERSGFPALQGDFDDEGLPRVERLESLWSLVVRRGLAGAEQIRAILREGVRGMRLDSATVSRAEGAEVVTEYADNDSNPEIGKRVPLEHSLARAALRMSGTFTVLDTEGDPEMQRDAGDVRGFLSSAFRVGEARWVLTFASKSPLGRPFDETDWNYVDNVVEALARAIERRESDARIERLAYTDPLTTLPNRVAVLTRLDEAMAEADRLGGRAGLLFLDLDGFKNVNDTVGHRGGDLVLAEVAQRLRTTLRRDEYIGRLGGDEFAIVMPHIAERVEIESIAQRIGNVLTLPFAIEEYKFSLSASIGVAIYPEDARQREDLLACADSAMYFAKDEGGSRVRFRDAGARFAQGAPPSPALTSGDTKDTGYILAYQPIVDPHNGRILGAEALIRQIHPLHGLLAPERGWSITKDEAGRRELDRWVLRETVTQTQAWSQGGMALRIDVNLAAFDTGEIDALLRSPDSAAALRRVRIEISPKQFSDESEAETARIAEFVAHCAANGIGFALDGFDGGLATLASLSHLPIDVVKLDRALVESVAQNRTARAVIEGTMIVAKSLGWQVIAKGVETAMQQQEMISLGCDGIQGFYVAHPMTAFEFGAWLREHWLPGQEG